MKNNQPRNNGKQQRQATSSDYQQLLRFRALCCYVSDEDMTGFTLLYNTAWTLQIGQDPRQTARLRPDHLPDQDPARLANMFYKTTYNNPVPPPPPRHLFFKLNAQNLYLNLTYPTRKQPTTQHRKTTKASDFLRLPATAEISGPLLLCIRWRHDWLYATVQHGLDTTIWPRSATDSQVAARPSARPRPCPFGEHVLQDNLQQPCPPPHLFFKLNAQILYLNLTHPTRKTTNHATPENNKGKRLPQITSNCWDFGPFAAMYPMKTWLALRYCTTQPGHYKVAKIRDRQPGCGQTICLTKTLPVWRTCFTRQLTTTLPPPPPFFKLNA